MVSAQPSVTEQRSPLLYSTSRWEEYAYAHTHTHTPALSGALRKVGETMEVYSRLQAQSDMRLFYVLSISFISRFESSLLFLTQNSRPLVITPMLFLF